MNKDAYYFPHFSNARHDRKLRRVRKELGVEGYGIYFMILEVLREQEDFAYPVHDIDLLADDFGTSEQKVEVVIMNYNLFLIDEDKFFYSPKLIEYLQPYLERSKRARKAALKRWHGDSNANADANALPEHSDSNASKVKESKVKKSKEEVSKIPTLPQVKEYFKENGYDPKVAEKAFSIYNASIEDHPKRKYWRDSRDNLIKNWKLKMQSVWFKEENKMNGKDEFNPEIAKMRKNAFK
ncbi:DUF4373 domain-containing protein [Gracilimonas sp.]|uniref:DUF4373 domain-containing protein n=1 Tax=Gracilimonas sp. TaxID=1974203 RepID=UPI002871B6BD|nr:DUF4373 domain-containing protein [Gracilimonas sp.]